MTYLDDHFDENVVNLIEKPEEVLIKSPRYQSIHKKRTTLEIARAKSSHKTMGPAKVPLNPPNNFLRKGSRIEPERPRTHHVHHRRLEFRQPLPEWKPRRAVSAQPEFPPRDPATLGRLNFRKRNIENAKTFYRNPCDNPRVVDTRKGDAQELLRSGLQPIYIYKKSFGQVPAHLKKLKKGTSAILYSKKYDHQGYESSKKDFHEQHSHKKPYFRYITEDERTKLLEEMKKNWSELMKKFQCLPFMIDTPPKIKRKALLEEKLKQLEKDVQLIENHPYIYVYDDHGIKH